MRKPKDRVEKYATAIVITRSLPALLPRSAIPGAISPTISKGIIKLKKLPNMAFITIKPRTKGVGKNRPHTIPNIMAMTIFGSNPIPPFLTVCS